MVPATEGLVRVIAALLMTANQGWGLQETKALLGVWGAEDVQRQLDGIVRNRIIYEKIAAELAELGYERTWQQCKTKIRNMIQKYRKVSFELIHESLIIAIILQVKDQNGVSGSDRKTCPFYEG